MRRFQSRSADVLDNADSSIIGNRKKWDLMRMFVKTNQSLAFSQLLVRKFSKRSEAALLPGYSQGFYQYCRGESVVQKCVRMDFEEDKDPNLNKLREKLNCKKIKLWLPPYLGSDEKKDPKALKKLAGSFSQELSIPKEQCLQLLEKLQTKALKNFKDHEKYLSTGEAALTVKVFYEVGETLINVEIDLARTGYDLKLRICRLASIIPHRVRVVFRGKLLKDDVVLQEQNIKHGLHTLAIGLKLSCQGLDLEYDQELREVKAVSDMVLLSRKGYFQDQEQFKQLSELPVEVRKYLLKGLRLHHIGREYIKKEDFGSALAMLLEAKEDLSHHEKSYLETFGSYLVLNIDIAWCYLNLQCLLLLPDAGEKLCQCEIDFKRVYGSNLERICAGTDFAWTALILIMRIHLMQAAVCYHRGRTFRAGVFLKKAEKELRSLKLNTRHVAHLMQLGYAHTEARFALRESKGDVDKAITLMEKKRGEMTAKLFEMVKKGQYLLKSELKERNVNPENREEGITKCLMEMGCSEEVIKLGLQQKKCPDSDDEDDDEEETEDSSGDQNPGNEAACLKTVVTIGFKPKKARAVLKKHGGNYEAAFRDLFKKEFLVSYERHLEVNADRKDNTDRPSRVIASRRTSGPSPAFSVQFREAMRYGQIYPERTENFPYDYIDIALTSEASFITKYKTLIKRAKEQLKSD